MKLHFLQMLRAGAAWLVIFDHALLELTHGRPADWVTHLAWTAGSAGVSVFFVISGFIMVLISWGSFARPAAATNFLRRRAIRIVPLYWLATLIALAYHRVSSTHGAHAGLSDVAYSFAFIPYCDEEGAWNPILPQGWTLNYEMMFYLVFAAGLFFRRQVALPLVSMGLGVFVIVGPFLPSKTAAFLASPIVLWFLLGIGLALLWRWRGLEEPEWLARLSKPLAPLGDASYSTYLVHGLILTMLLRAWTMVLGPPSIWIVPVSLAAATIGGWAVHVVVEKPLLRLVTDFWIPSGKIGIGGNVSSRG